MSINAGPIVSTNGLVLNIDAANSNSLNNVNRNFLNFSEDLTNAYWLKSNCSILANSAIAPDGTLTADKIIANTASALHYTYTTVSVVSGTTYVWSCYAKASEYNFIQFNRLDIGGVSASFNLTTGTVNNVSSGTASMVPLGNGWYRCIFVYTPLVTLSIPIGFQPLDSTGAAAFIGNDINGVLAWGLQFEIGSVVSTYYPVNSSIQPSTTWSNLNSTTPSLPNLTQVEVLVVAGGGSGGGTAGGGGGGGGVLYNPAFSVADRNSYTVTVGTGGAAVNGGGTGNSGTNSSLSGLLTITALGGGGGAPGGGNTAGVAGGSGGGASGSGTPGVGTTNQGNNGGIGGSTYTGGGGGGAGALGGSGNSTNNAGAGGIGYLSTISGTPAYYGGGGGGGTIFNTASGSGGLGGGGRGGFSGGTPGTNATANTGGGGGGGGNNNPIDGSLSGAGGSGIVIIRYLGAPSATGGIITSVNGYTIHTFTSGTSNFVVNRSTTSLINSPIYSPNNGGHLVFNGSMQYAEYTDNLNFDNDFTVSLFAKSETYFTGAGIFTKTDSGGYSTAKGFSITNISNPQTVYVWASNGISTKVIQLAALSTYTWTEITITKTASLLTAYTNGTLVGSIDITGFGSINGSQNLFLGKGNNTFWSGSLSTVRMYNRALSATEIQQNFNALRSRYGI